MSQQSPVWLEDGAVRVVLYDMIVGKEYTIYSPNEIRVVRTSEENIRITGLTEK